MDKNQIYFSYWSLDPDNISASQKQIAIRAYINRILAASDWTQLPDSGLTLSEQVEQQELRAAWMALDDPGIDPDTIVFPEMPMTERP